MHRMIKDFSFKFLPADFRKLYFRFNGEEKDVLQSIGALKSAIAVLGKHNTELAQVSQAADDPSVFLDTLTQKMVDKWRRVRSQERPFMVWARCLPSSSFTLRC